MAELQLVSCAVRRGRPLLMSCSPLRNTIEWTHHAGTRRRGSGPFLPATSYPDFAAAMDAYRRADGFVLPSHEAGLIFSLQSTAMPVLVTEAELLSRRELRPPTSHPAGPASAPLSRIRAKWSSKRAAPFSKTEQCCPWLASVAAPSDRSGASHAYSVSIVIAVSVD